MYVKVSDAMNQLGISKKEPLWWVLRLFERRSVFEVYNAVPTVLMIDVLSSEMSQEVAEIIAKGKKNQNLGYKIFLKDFFIESAPEELELDQESARKSGLSSNTKNPDKNCQKKSEIDLNRYFDMWMQINSLAGKGQISFEILDWTLVLKVKEHLTDVEIYQMLNERARTELEIIQKV